MGWKQLDFKERWSLATSALQAGATLGMLVVAVVGVWKVTPIITYQVQQQQSELAQMVPEPNTDPLVVDALAWWTGQLRGYRSVVTMIDESVRQDREVSFELLPGGGTAIAPGVSPDLLTVSTPGSRGATVSVPVNQNAMSPSQYLRFRVNQGAFSGLPEEQRRRVELEVERYINRHMVPAVPPITVRADMTIGELRTEVALNAHHRDEALRHIKGLEETIAVAMQ